MQSAAHPQSTFLYKVHSTTARHLVHSVLELHHAETTTSTSQLEAQFQVAQIGQFPENRDDEESVR
jgi:hypothetical protein